MNPFQCNTKFLTKHKTPKYALPTYFFFLKLEGQNGEDKKGNDR